MEEKRILIIVASVLVSGCAWLYIELAAEKKRRNKLLKENTKLIADNALLEGEHLKFQLQPHTLRNMVATLYAASKNLFKGTEALADTLDYVLYHDNNHLVSVADELAFLESYKALQGNFVYQTNSITLDKSAVDLSSKYYTSPCLPHLVTAYLIENAFKHGDVVHPNFLKIKIRLSQNIFEMSVVNRINQNTIIKKGGVGLTNMQKRLDLFLHNRFKIEVKNSNHEYSSTLTICF